MLKYHLVRKGTIGFFVSMLSERRYTKTQISQINLVMLLFNCETKQDVRSTATCQLFSIDNEISI
jgi:uncharacterized membrane protein